MAMGHRRASIQAGLDHGEAPRSPHARARQVMWSLAVSASEDSDLAAGDSPAGCQAPYSSERWSSIGFAAVVLVHWSLARSLTRTTGSPAGASGSSGQSR